MNGAGSAGSGVADLVSLLGAVDPSAGTRTTQRANAPLLDHLAIGASAGPYLVPAGHRGPMIRPLLAYRRLRPLRPRLGRLGVAAAVGAGLGGRVGRRVRADGPMGTTLIEHLAAVLGVPGLRFAGSARECREFVTPVLQLLGPDGTTIAFAKFGWDEVTDRMVTNEADALELVARVAPEAVHAPAVRWTGAWNGHAVLVTAPMPRSVRRLRRGTAALVDAMRVVAALDGPLQRERLDGSEYWRAARATAASTTSPQRDALVARLADAEARFGEVELEFGRWHGDWVPWNLARDGRALHVWDWAYSAPRVPVGLDAIHAEFLPRVVLDGRSADDASAAAARHTDRARRGLGIGATEWDAVVAVHRIEVDLREVRAHDRRCGGARTVPAP